MVASVYSKGLRLMGVNVGDLVAMQVARNPDYWQVYQVESVDGDLATARNMLPLKFFMTKGTAERAGRDHLVGPMIAKGFTL